ncbi:hypothetical protein IT774_13930 [Salinimonas marina]|uniref:Uncharacterized protein n=1 Tax=Salinimonas marina TaxID=2785918 RepID=A0A7S9HCL1_9ALTE|nr:hypothetical protein [Salinimonas marina]QPG05209.1 hypothetical protein IT774_13930 [Salinimonas marina]
MSFLSLLCRMVVALLPAWVVTYVLACVFHSQRVIHALTEVDVKVAVSERLSMSAYDLWGLLPSYGAAIALALVLSMMVVALLLRWMQPSSLIAALVAALGGAMAMLVMLLSMQPIMGVTLIAGAREITGIMLQCFAGAVGGVVFQYCFKPGMSATP